MFFLYIHMNSAPKAGDYVLTDKNEKKFVEGHLK